MSEARRRRKEKMKEKIEKKARKLMKQRIKEEKEKHPFFGMHQVPHLLQIGRASCRERVCLLV